MGTTPGWPVFALLPEEALARPIVQGTIFTNPFGVIEGIKGPVALPLGLATGPGGAVRTQWPIWPAQGELIGGVVGVLWQIDAGTLHIKGHR
jgi:hypothetical protein